MALRAVRPPGAAGPGRRRRRGPAAPLLPGASPSLTLVTTRTRDWRLPGETRYRLNPLSPTESATLFHAATGRPLTSLTTALTACGGNPGALHAVATQLAIRPQWTASDLADWLASAPLAPGLTGSYRRLSAGARSAFHALAALPPEFDTRQASQQLGLSHPETRRLLEELTDHHLLEAPAPSRFQTHPLVRAQARATRPLSNTRVA